MMGGRRQSASSAFVGLPRWGHFGCGLAQAQSAAQRGLRSASNHRLVARTRWLAIEAAPASPPLVAGSQGQVDLALGFPPTRGLVFDMDGTLVEPSIDFALMRKKVEIPEGDLFNQMERWDDPERVALAMEVINDLEADAVSVGKLVLAGGIHRLLKFCAKASLKVALVTRNTSPSVESFLQLLTPEDRAIFELIITREFRHVKPDKRIMESIADQWNMHPSELMMIGDSKEDVEVGNAGGSMSCLVLGGGNETKPAATSRSFTKEGMPTFKVTGLDELSQIVEGAWRRTPIASPVLSSVTTRTLMKPLEMQFMDDLITAGHINAGYCTYPRLAAAFGCEELATFDGDRLLHFGCGDGFLTKLFGSLGLQTTATDHQSANIDLTLARGLEACLVKDLAPQSQDVATAFAEDWLISPSWARSVSDLQQTLADVAPAVKSGGSFALEFPVNGNAMSISELISDSLTGNAAALKALSLDTGHLDAPMLASSMTECHGWVLAKKDVVLQDVVHLSAERLAEDVVDQCGRALCRSPGGPFLDDLDPLLEKVAKRLIDSGSSVVPLRRVRIVLTRT